MDELELLKKHWKTTTDSDQKLSAKQLYPMLLKKSSSIVKTLFYISIAELVFWILINFLPMLSSSYLKELDQIYGNNLAIVLLSVVTFSVVIVFVYLLYKAYKNISITDNTKQLMASILKTQKIVKYYVIYNLSMIFLSVPISLYFTSQNDSELHDKIIHFTTSQTIVFYLITFVLTGICVLIFWLFYKLIYGILLKRLNKNYLELKKLEM
ncbi:hypothetical protein ES677_00255 [Bizionia gelidisalsuginis]|uniref:Uncharacterized protein n=1 Tax=Bizionia gelidisalsuginis TaxID=291188 RepID=A0ABY3ME26_9FLAO|nr:hypothetical protein [Bizionia gelidisalsuginis]TYC17843.1 hypothetical protein ES677_00255 [Bizionia gelidisalsuginis]